MKTRFTKVHGTRKVHGSVEHGTFKRNCSEPDKHTISSPETNLLN